MKQFKLTFLLIVLYTSTLFQIYGQNKIQPEINVVYGDKHIFTIETPTGWINDKESAEKIGLVCFFYAIEDKDKAKKSYMYAFGIDKLNADENLDGFIKGDLEKFREKYPGFTFEKIPVEFTGGLRNGVLYSFSELTDRFKEEVLYGETDDSFLIFSFAAMTFEDFEKYQPVFDEFISTFNYRGNNPQPFLDYMNSK